MSDAPAPAAVAVAPMSPADLPEVLAVHGEAFADAMNVRMGPAYLRVFFRWFLRAPRAVALVARVDGRVAGYVVGDRVGYQRALNLRLIPRALPALLLRPGLLLRPDIQAVIRARARLALGLAPASPPSAWPVAPPLPEPVISLVGIGVAGAARGRGVGAALMTAFEARARALGYRSARLSVYDDNERAHALYARAGWREWERVGARTLVLARALDEAPGPTGGPA